MKQYYLMPEYECSPIWIDDAGGKKNLDTQGLDLSTALKEQIVAWDQKYQHTLCQTYPPDSGFKSESEAELFEKEGIEILHLLEKELGPDSQIQYVPIA